MAILSKAQQVSRAVKSAGRLREIASAMSRFGFGAVVERWGFSSEARQPVDSSDARPLPVRLRLVLEQLGPTFIKVGQILAGRPDLVPADIVRELEKLQDRVAPMPFLALKPILEEDLGRTLDACYASFDPEPLAIASIAQVHAARTLDGEEVVVKIKKPDVDRVLTQDLEILDMLATLSERYVPELKAFRPRVLVAEFRKALLAETNFTLEANSIKRFRENFAANPFLVIPKVYPDLSSARVITMQRVHGVRLSDVEAVKALGVDPREVLRQGMECFYQSMMVDGFFHGDPHGGNILVLADGRLGLIDFGSVGRLSGKARDSLINMFLALLTQDYDMLVMEYLNMSPETDSSRSSTAIAAIQREVGEVFSPYHGLPLKDIPVGKLLMEAAGIAFRHRVTVPRDLILVFKAIMTLEGIGRQLDPDFDLVSAASKYTRVVLRERYEPRRLMKDAMFIGRDLVRFLEKAPRQAAEALRQLENGELRTNLHINNLEALVRAQTHGHSRVAMSILAAGLIIGAVEASAEGGPPVWGQIAIWACAITVGTLTFLRSWK